MSAAIATAVAGWALAGAALGALVRARREQAWRGELVARACHELRGPLHAAGLALHAVARGATSSTRDRVGAIELELHRARLALEDLQGAPRGECPRDGSELVDIGELVRRQAAAWRAAAGGGGIAVLVREPRGPVLVRGDRLRLAQATGNLVGNALEHGRGQVQLRVRPATDERVAIEVIDGGPGLPASVPALAARARGGRGRRGRGLAIAADIAARHGGRLAAAPSARGARLVLELPLAAEAGGLGPRDAEEPAS